MSPYKIAVFDIGKTNKKLLVYDSDLVCLNPSDRPAVFPEIEIDGLRCDDMPGIHRWMLDSLADAVRRFGDIRAVSISAHGATLAFLAADGSLAFPVVSYMQPLSPEEDDAFYSEMGLSPAEMQQATGTARFGFLINHAKAAWLLKRQFADRFASVDSVLMLPSYIAWLLTGRKSSEPTYIGCHGYLLDISGQKYSAVADALGLTQKLPALPFAPPWTALGPITDEVARRTGLSPDTIVTVGVHDSNAALVPYFASGRTDFVLQDSGTWVVTMSPCADARFEDSEIGREVFFNRSIYSTPVKTTIFRGGAEFDFYAGHVLSADPHPDTVDTGVLRSVLARREAFVLPTIERGSGLFPESIARIEGIDTVFVNPVATWCAVDLGLAVQGFEAIRLAAGESPPEIFIEGNIGANNPIYRAALATLFPGSKVSFGSTGGAPFGAGLLALAAIEGKRPEDFASRFSLGATAVAPLDVDSSLMRAYADAFLARLR